MLYHGKQPFYLSMVPFQNAGQVKGLATRSLCDSTVPTKRRRTFSKVLNWSSRRKTSPHSSSWDIVYSYVDRLTSRKEGFLLLDWCLDWTQSKLEKFLKNSATRTSTSNQTQLPYPFLNPGKIARDALATDHQLSDCSRLVQSPSTKDLLVCP